MINRLVLSTIVIVIVLFLGYLVLNKKQDKIEKFFEDLFSLQSGQSQYEIMSKLDSDVSQTIVKVDNNKKDIASVSTNIDDWTSKLFASSKEYQSKTFVDVEELQNKQRIISNDTKSLNAKIESIKTFNKSLNDDVIVVNGKIVEMNKLVDSQVGRYDSQIEDATNKFDEFVSRYNSKLSAFATDTNTIMSDFQTDTQGSINDYKSKLADTSSKLGTWGKNFADYQSFSSSGLEQNSLAIEDVAYKTEGLNKSIADVYGKIDNIQALIKYYVTKTDLNNYLTKSDMSDHPTKTELDTYATKNDISKYALRKDLGNYAPQSEVQPAIDIVNTAKKTLDVLKNTVNTIGADYVNAGNFNKKAIDATKVDVIRAELNDATKRVASIQAIINAVPSTYVSNEKFPVLAESSVNVSSLRSSIEDLQTVVKDIQAKLANIQNVYLDKAKLGPLAIEATGSLDMTNRISRASVDMRNLETLLNTINENYVTKANLPQMALDATGVRSLQTSLNTTSTQLNTLKDKMASLENAGYVNSAVATRFTPDNEIIKSRAKDNLCIDVLGWSKDNGGELGIFTCGPSQTNQQFILDGSKRLINKNSGKCVNVKDSKADDNTPITQMDCNNANNQKWEYDAQNRIHPVHAKDKCLDILNSNAQPGSKLVINKCNDSLSQKWFVDNPNNLSMIAIKATQSDVLRSTLDALSKTTNDANTKLATIQKDYVTRNELPALAATSTRLDTIATSVNTLTEVVKKLTVDVTALVNQSFAKRTEIGQIAIDGTGMGTMKDTLSSTTATVEKLGASLDALTNSITSNYILKSDVTKQLQGYLLKSDTSAFASKADYAAYLPKVEAESMIASLANTYVAKTELPKYATKNESTLLATKAADLEGSMNKIDDSIKVIRNITENSFNPKNELIKSNRRDNLCIDVLGWSKDNGGELGVFTCGPWQENQQFTLDGDKRLVNKNSGRCMGVTGGKTDENTPIIQTSCSADLFQKWEYDSQGRLHPVHAKDKCLEIAGGSDQPGAKLVINKCNDKSSQKWYQDQMCVGSTCFNKDEWLRVKSMVGNFQPFAPNNQVIKSKRKDNLCIDVLGWQKDSGTDVGVWTCGTTQENQQFIRDENKRLVNKNSGKCMDVLLGRSDNNTPVIQHTCHDGTFQRWEYDNQSRLHPMHAMDKCLDIAGNSDQNGAKLVINQCNDNPSQKWVL